MEEFNYRVIDVDFEESHHFNIGEVVKLVSETSVGAWNIYENKDGIQQILSESEVKKVN